jgi:hypothetical protein
MCEISFDIKRAGTVQIFLKLKFSQMLYIIITYPEFYPNWPRHIERRSYKCATHEIGLWTQIILFFYF